jgi:hypothetical protein
MNKVIRRALGGAVVVVGVGGLVAAAALAGIPPPPSEAGCPKGGNWNLRPLDATIEADQGNFHDQNGDGFICQFSNPNNNPSGFPDWVVKDNTKKQSENGLTPP